MGGVGPRLFVPAAAEIVEVVRADRIAGEAFSRRYGLDPVVLPQPAWAAKRAEPALGRQPRAGQDDDVLVARQGRGATSPCRSGRGGGGNGRQARSPSSPRRSARRGCRRKDR